VVGIRRYLPPPFQGEVVTPEVVRGPCLTEVVLWFSLQKPGWKVVWGQVFRGSYPTEIFTSEVFVLCFQAALSNRSCQVTTSRERSRIQKTLSQQLATVLGICLTVCIMTCVIDVQCACYGMRNDVVFFSEQENGLMNFEGPNIYRY